MSKKKKNKDLFEVDTDAAELNIMPFIDVFSVLNTFLLMSAVFLSVGIIKVQIPFFTSKETPDKPKRSLSVNVDVQVDKVTVDTVFSAPPTNPQKYTFNMHEDGILALHQRLVMIRTENKDTDLVTVFSDDEVTFESLTKVLDAIRVRKKTDPKFENPAETPEEKIANTDTVFPKLVMGSVVL